MQKITAHADGTYSWETPDGHFVRSCVLPYSETFFDRTLVGYAVLSYSLWVRTILRENWKTYIGPKPPKWMYARKLQPITLD